MKNATRRSGKIEPKIEIGEPRTGVYFSFSRRKGKNAYGKKQTIQSNYENRIKDIEKEEKEERQKLKAQDEKKRALIIKLHDEALEKIENEKKRRKNLANEAKESIIAETPLPSLSLILEGDGEPLNADHNENQYRFTFTKVDRDKLTEIKTNKKQMLFASNTPSPEFQKIQEKLGAFDAEFSKIENSLGNNMDDIKANALRLKTLFDEIKQNCETYLEKHKGYRWTPTGRARKALVVETERIISEKIQTLQETFQRMDTRNKQQLSKRNAELAKIETDENIDNSYKDTIKEINEKEEKELKSLDTETRNTSEELTKNVATKKQAALEEKVKELKALSDNKVESKGQLQYTTKDMLSDRQRSIMAGAQFAKLIFDDKYNPFKCYYTKPMEADSTEKAIGDTSFKQDAHNLQVLKERLTKLNPKLPITYSPDALMTMSNLSFYDKIMNYKRKPNDVYVDYVIFDKKQNQLKEEDVAKMSENDIKEKGIFCVVKNVRAEIVPSSQRYPFNQFKAAEFIFREGAFINLNTFERFMNLNKEMIKSSINMAPEEAINMFADAVAETRKRHNIRYGTYNLRNPSSMLLNIVSEKAFMKGISQGLVENMAMGETIVSNRPYFTVDDDHYDMDLLKNEGKLSLDSNKDMRQFSEGIEEFKKRIAPRENLKLINPSKYDERFNEILKNDSESEVGRLVQDIMKLRSMSEEDAVNNFRYAYPEGILEHSKKTNEKRKKLLARNTVYDEKATALYVRVSRFLKDHADEIGKAGTYAELLSKWKEEMFPEGRLIVPKDPNAIYIDTTLPISDEKKKQGYLETEDELLFSSQILSDLKNYKSDELEKKYDLSNQKVVMLDVPDEPLFPKKPNISEIHQGNLGNCFFLAALNCMVNDDPQSVEEMMKDNGDGTVTCRFFNDLDKPVYVKVKKSIPVSLNGNLPTDIACAANSEKVPLWVHILEKAYVLSGLKTYKYDKNEVATNIRQSIAKRENWNENLTNDQLISKFVQKRFPNLKTNAEIESHAKQILNAGYFCISGGKAEAALKRFTGKRTERENIKTSSGTNILEMLTNISSQMDHLVLRPMEYTNKVLLGKLGDEAFRILYNERVFTAYDNNKEKYNGIKHISIEKLEDAITHAANRLSKKEPDKNVASEIVDLAKKLNKDMSEFQMSDKPKKYVLRFNKPGSYSKEARDIYNKIKDARNDHRMVSCFFRQKTETVSKGNKAVALGKTAERMQSGGVITNHAFSVIDVIQKDGLLYVQVRNPWGHGERVKQERQVINDSGKESIKSYGTQDVPDNRIGGIFEMELNTFVKHVESIGYMRAPLINSVAPAKEDNAVQIQEGGKLI